MKYIYERDNTGCITKMHKIADKRKSETDIAEITKSMVEMHHFLN